MPPGRRPAAQQPASGTGARRIAGDRGECAPLHPHSPAPADPTAAGEGWDRTGEKGLRTQLQGVERLGTRALTAGCSPWDAVPNASSSRRSAINSHLVHIQQLPQQRPPGGVRRQAPDHRTQQARRGLAAAVATDRQQLRREAAGGASSSRVKIHHQAHSFRESRHTASGAMRCHCRHHHHHPLTPAHPPRYAAAPQTAAPGRAAGSAPRSGSGLQHSREGEAGVWAGVRAGRQIHGCADHPGRAGVLELRPGDTAGGAPSPLHPSTPSPIPYLW